MHPRRIARMAEGLALLSAPGWDDVTNPATTTKVGVLDKPDFDYTNIGRLFPQNDASEKAYISGQMRHAWEGSSGRRCTVYPHLHYIQDEAQVPEFTLEYRFYDNGGAVPNFTTISSSAGSGLQFPYASGTILQILDFPDISLSGFGSSAWYDMILYRTDNVASGDVLVKGFDWHSRFTDLGSRTEYRK